VVTVTAGRPTEYSFTVRTASTGTTTSRVRFEVTNLGRIPHRFEVCAKPLFGILADACRGTATAVIAPGKSASLLVTFERSGTYEYLSSIAGQAAEGMRGTIGITLPSKPAVSPSVSQGAAGGATLFRSLGCSSCHSEVEVQAAGNVTPDINSTHLGGPFPDGPLTEKQIQELAAYLNI